MAKIIDIQRDLHEINVRRIAKRILHTFGSSAVENDIAEAIHHPIRGLNNWFTIKFLINRYFPSPSLSHVRDPESVETLVICNVLKSIREPHPVSGISQEGNPPRR